MTAGRDETMTNGGRTPRPDHAPDPAGAALDRLRTIRAEWRDARGLSSIARRLYGRGVAFVHVPKCAGRSVERALRRSYRWSRGHTHAGATFDHAARLRDGPADQQSLLWEATGQRAEIYAYHLALGVKCVTGHAPVSQALIDAYGGTHAFVTVLRDPVARFVSHYRYSYRSGGHGAIELQLCDFLDTPRARTFGSIYLKYFAHGAAEAEAERAARRCLDAFEVVGFLDDLPGFETALRRRLKRRVRIGHVNAGPGGAGRGPGAEIEGALRRRIEEICAPDIAIYHWARSRWA